MLYHPLAYLSRIGIGFGHRGVPDANNHALALVELLLDEPFVANMQWLPTAWQQHALRLLKQVRQLINQFGDALALLPTGVEGEMGALGSVKRVGYPCEVGDFPTPSLCIQPLRVTFLADL